MTTFTPDDIATIQHAMNALDGRIASAGVTEAGIERHYRPKITALKDLAARIRDAIHSSALPTDGAALIARERQRQIDAEGWTPAHDDEHSHGEMAITAACYAANGTDAEVLVHGEDAWPWGSCDDKRKQHSRVRQLAIAGALIAAEIDRLQRQTGVAKEGAVGVEPGEASANARMMAGGAT
jgi:hypothetical protein